MPWKSFPSSPILRTSCASHCQFLLSLGSPLLNCWFTRKLQNISQWESYHSKAEFLRKRMIRSLNIYDFYFQRYYVFSEWIITYHPTSSSSNCGSISLTFFLRPFVSFVLSSSFLLFSGNGKKRGASAFDLPDVRDGHFRRYLIF